MGFIYSRGGHPPYVTVVRRLDTRLQHAAHYALRVGSRLRAGDDTLILPDVSPPLSHAAGRSHRFGKPVAVLRHVCHVGLHLFRRVIMLVRRDRPDVAEWVDELAVAVAPEHVG